MASHMTFYFDFIQFALNKKGKESYNTFKISSNFYRLYTNIVFIFLFYEKES